MNSHIRKAYYLSIEYLPGRIAVNNIINGGKDKDFTPEQLAAIDEEEIISEYPGILTDPALGNGGLGRLASCYLDSAAAINKPVVGYGLYYKYGLFRQSFDNGAQKEAADDWGASIYALAVPKPKEAVFVKFSDFTAKAVPHDVTITGYGGGETTLRLWEARRGEEFDFAAFDNGDYSDMIRSRSETITKCLYPRDESEEGRILRIRQEYLLAAASIADVLRGFEKTADNNIPKLSDIEKYCVFQLNDTHPVWAIPEFVRICVNKYGYDIAAAFDTARKIFRYTNHTIMAEALEKWNRRTVTKIIPNTSSIIDQIREILYGEIGKSSEPIIKPDLHQSAVTPEIEKAAQGVASAFNPETYDFMVGDEINMGKLALYTAKKVNGVAEIHSELLKTDVFPEWYALYPDKFVNVTNGVTPRRWLKQCNPELTALIADTLGSDAFVGDLSLIKGLKLDTDKFSAVKQTKKNQLAKWLKDKHNIAVDPTFIFDIQVKRFHEYKRQLLNALSILDVYYSIKDGSITNFAPTLYLFGGKSAPGYRRAKAIIKFINTVADIINTDPTVKGKMQVAFIPDYNVSAAQLLIPSADVSEQISTAGLEASGTSNMKFSLNGAVTLGTLDGANIEIFREAGEGNNYVFGATVDELKSILPNYNPREIVVNDKKLGAVLAFLGKCDKELYHSLVTDYNYQYYFSGD
ncbi:MAG: glycogen/starch/alpha-glucan family phosphorylase, partial [Oscillospiraceae bacterium]|nr:glycogen/starch/alpha-glucan family phosphorylase [Oscillospiraceae bacterium]